MAKSKDPNAGVSPQDELNSGVRLAQKYRIPLPPESVPEHAILYAQTYVRGIYHLLNEYDNDQTIQGLINGHEQIHRFARNTLNQNPQTEQFACKKGCWYCCTLRIGCSGLEVLFTARYLKENLSKQELDQLMGRIDEYLEKWNQQTSEEKLNTSKLCPLNVNGQCTAHKARPSACVRYHSINLNSCIQSYEEGLLPLKQQPESHTPVKQSPHHNELCTQAFQPSIEFLAQLNLDSRILQFVPALKLALTEQNIEERFFSGELVFEGAYDQEIDRLEQSFLSRKRISDSIRNMPVPE